MARVKGTQIADLAKALRGLGERLGRPIPEHLEHYLEEPVLVSGWYPEADFHEMMLLVGRAIEPDVEGNVWRFLGEQGAIRDAAGIYASWIHEGDPARTLERFTQAWRAVRDTGRLAMTPHGSSGGELVLRAYPVMCPELAETNAGYLAEMLRASGASDVKVQLLELFDDGARWTISWS